MGSRKDWFKEFVRSLDKKAPYEDRKDLASKALRTRYGQESSLLASEDRLLGGVFQHRAGKFPWGTSKKDREKSRKLASSSSVQEPLPAGARKREHANSPASMPPVLPSGPLLIDLLDVKEEEVHLGRRVRSTFGSAKSLADR